MHTMANPTRRLQLLDEKTVLRHRNLFCSEYDDCLEIAVNAEWTSWSCEKCPLAKVMALPPRRRPAAPAAPTAEPMRQAVTQPLLDAVTQLELEDAAEAELEADGESALDDGCMLDDESMLDDEPLLGAEPTLGAVAEPAHH